MPLRIGRKPVARRIDGAVFADAGDDIGQCPAFGNVIPDVIGGHEGNAGGVCKMGQTGQPPGIVTPVEMAGGQIRI